MMSVLGLPLENALNLLNSPDICVEEIKPPRGECPRGTLRVVRQTETRLTVCRFPDDVLENSNA